MQAAWFHFPFCIVCSIIAHCNKKCKKNKAKTSPFGEKSNTPLSVGSPTKTPPLQAVFLASAGYGIVIGNAVHRLG